MSEIMAKIAKTLVKAVVGTTAKAVSTSNYMNSTESAFVRSSRAKSLNSITR